VSRRPAGMRTIHYQAGDEASAALAAADPALARIIAEVGCVDLRFRFTLFESVIHSIVGQQLSGVAAQRIWERVIEQVGSSPEAVAGASVDELRAVGLSGRKAEYVQGVAQAVISGELDLAALEAFSDDEVVERLMALRGVGPWTAHMFLIFALGRPDVLADGDGGVRSMAGRILGLGRPATSSELQQMARSWVPYRSVALLYLWAAGDSGAFLRCETGDTAD
jgi:DNA-3-methyladenine glycosylase II